MVDAIGGAATIILAIVALSGISQSMLGAIATVVFGAALLIQSGTMLTEFTKLIAPPGAAGTAQEFVGGGGLSALFLVGAAGIVLGVLSLVGISPQTLTAAAVIAFGGALLLSSNSVWHLYRAKQASYRAGAARTLSGAEFLAGEMASGSAFLQCLSGLAAIVLGILAVTGTHPSVRTLVGLLILGATVLFDRQHAERRGHGLHGAGCRAYRRLLVAVAVGRSRIAEAKAEPPSGAVVRVAASSVWFKPQVAGAAEFVSRN